MILKIELIGNTPSSKNSKVFNVGRKMCFSSAACSRWKKINRYFLNTLPRGIDWKYPVKVKMNLYFSDKKARDWNNISQIIMDELTPKYRLLPNNDGTGKKHREMIDKGIIADDDMAHAKPVYGDFGYDKNNPRAEIIITDEE